MIRAYIVLVHAEIENSVEDLVSAAAQKMLAQWQSAGVAGAPLQSLLAYADPKELSDAWHRQTSGFRYQNVVQKFAKVVEGNMGIRAQNVLRLLLAIGVPRADIDGLWLTEVDEFGKERGLIAHRSVAAATHLPDAGRARNRVAIILNGLRDIDDAVQRVVRRRCNPRTLAAVDDALKGRHEVLRGTL